MTKFLILKSSNDGVEIFDMSLTPTNAKRRGFVYIKDINYDLYSLNKSLDKVIKLVYENGYKLGTPSREYNFATFYGLYAPKEQ